MADLSGATSKILPINLYQHHASYSISSSLLLLCNAPSIPKLYSNSNRS